MTIGFGIFLSTLALCSLLLYRWTYQRWNWKKIFFTGVLCALSLCVLAGGAIWAYHYWTNRPTVQNSYAGVSLGMSKEEVTYIKGQNHGVYKRDPTDKGHLIQVHGIGHPTKDEPWLADAPVALPDGSILKDYDIWTYDDWNETWAQDFGNGRNLTLTIVIFDEKTKKVSLIGCGDTGTNCPAIFSIVQGTNESVVQGILGNPTKQGIEGEEKIMEYSQFNLRLYLKKEKVVRLAVTNTSKW
jgi:hypothetical protein